MLVPRFQLGIEIGPGDLPQALNELSRLKAWIDQETAGPEGDHVVERITRLKSKLTEILTDTTRVS